MKKSRSWNLLGERFARPSLPSIPLINLKTKISNYVIRQRLNPPNKHTFYNPHPPRHTSSKIQMEKEDRNPEASPDCSMIQIKESTPQPVKYSKTSKKWLKLKNKRPKTKRKKLPKVLSVPNLVKKKEVNHAKPSNRSSAKIFMKEYLRRQKLPEESKVFIVRGPFDYIKRAVRARGWLENSYIESKAFHLKWTTIDSKEDYLSLLPGQLFNHIANNQHITTKSGLLRNLRSSVECGVKIDDFFPRSYDLGDNHQIEQLVSDYEQTAIINIVKNHAYAFNHNEFSADLELLTQAVRQCEYLIKLAEDNCNGLKKYPFTKDPLIDQRLPLLNKEALLQYSQNPENRDIATPQLVARCSEVAAKIQAIGPQVMMEGSRNIWIIKPGQNSRGSGVRCVKSLKDILASQMQGRIVQKYIEKPLLIPRAAGLCKFDIRQWVLVTSVNPLTIYFFNSNYIRVCQEAFSLDNLDASLHLTNFAIQKNNARSQEETVMKLCELKSYLKESWDYCILPQIHKMVIRSIQSVSEHLEDRAGCFELLGFDIILDEWCKPWLLEVNLSPSCAERTDWLSSMLDTMARGLLHIIIDSPKHSPLYGSSLEQLLSVQGDTKEWVLLYRGDHAQPGISHTCLEINGQKIDIKREKRNERNLYRELAALVIQKKFREFLKRKNNLYG